MRLARIVTYPVKGCAGTSLPEARVTPAGVKHDREFMITSVDGTFRSQRRDPRMATIRPEVLADGARLLLRAPGADDLEIDIDPDGPATAVSVHTWHGKGTDQGERAADWCSTVLGTPSRLVRVPRDHQRETSGLTPGTTGFADGHALLLASESSLDSLNERILERGGEPVPMNRFRPNLVLSGADEPHAEDRMRELSIGGVRLGYAKYCIRCAVPTIDQETGHKSGPEPTRTLATYRRVPEGGVAFGMKAAVTVPGHLAVGDPVIVHKSG